ncbi:hypothetical protein NIBR502772_05945 [Pseudarthrobacter sp. NIBRBAC000502772]|uniref:hypothetical protein n=1 Tax=Pseudarthrobacter sp. NIBRBAC000502772 TaxID=2590775 RepID=UPI0011311073|nr:hypothetical protein [Pseudarthrobacter sp. NIBRBAC000502772]QDG65816.1 hypothetical protein NIBR502772_05945 [Pseudarthrobacter sp. NIBRBAC000502772]
MKALELTIYPPIHRPRYGYGIDPYREQWKRERNIIEAKRLTDAELAAEYWRSTWDAQSCYHDGSDEDITATRKEYEALERFATLPHYDEDPR